MIVDLTVMSMDGQMNVMQTSNRTATFLKIPS